MRVESSTKGGKLDVGKVREDRGSLRSNLPLIAVTAQPLRDELCKEVCSEECQARKDLLRKTLDKRHEERTSNKAWGWQTTGVRSSTTCWDVNLESDMVI